MKHIPSSGSAKIQIGEDGSYMQINQVNDFSVFASSAVFKHFNPLLKAWFTLTAFCEKSTKNFLKITLIFGNPNLGSMSIHVTK